MKILANLLLTVVILAAVFFCFLTINDEPTYTSLAESFRVFMCCDIILIAGALLSLFIEMMLILRKGAEK